MKNAYLLGLFALCILLCANIAVADEAISVRTFSMYNDTDITVDVGRGIEVNIFGPDLFDEPAISAVFTKSQSSVGENIIDVQHRLNVWTSYGTLISRDDSGTVSDKWLSVCPVEWTNPVHQSGVVVVKTYSNRTEVLFADTEMKATQYDSEFGVKLSAIDGSDVEAYTMDSPDFYPYKSTLVTGSTKSLMVYDP